MGILELAVVFEGIVILILIMYVIGISLNHHKLEKRTDYHGDRLNATNARIDGNTENIFRAINTESDISHNTQHQLNLLMDYLGVEIKQPDTEMKIVKKER